MSEKNYGCYQIGCDQIGSFQVASVQHFQFSIAEAKGFEKVYCKIGGSVQAYDSGHMATIHLLEGKIDIFRTNRWIYDTLPRYPVALLHVVINRCGVPRAKTILCWAK